MMKELNMSEMRSIQLEMLDKLDTVCKKHGIRYYLCGGTLLGAIRHKGYIPWDDDIDINILRPDLDKLLKYTGGTIGDDLYFEKPGDQKGKSLIFYRLFNKRTRLVSRNLKLGTKVDTKIFIDIFPVDALPSSLFITKGIYLWSGLLISLGNMSSVGKVVATSPIKRIAKSIIFPVAKLHTPEEWALITDKYAKKRNYDKAKYIGVINTEASHRFHERILKGEYEPVIKVDFENRKYPAPLGYDQYLRNLYGDDYMKIPPKEVQVSHHDFTAYIIEEDE